MVIRLDNFVITFTLMHIILYKYVHHSRISPSSARRRSIGNGIDDPAACACGRRPADRRGPPAGRSATEQRLLHGATSYCIQLTGELCTGPGDNTAELAMITCQQHCGQTILNEL